VGGDTAHIGKKLPARSVQRCGKARRSRRIRCLEVVIARREYSANPRGEWNSAGLQT